MQINLRKANAIQSEIRKAIHNFDASNIVTVTEFTPNIDETVNKAAEKYNEAISKKIALNAALFSIRSAVGKANSESGINDILAQVQETEALISIKTGVALAQPRKEMSEINARIEKLKNTTNERSPLYGDRYQSVETSVLSQETIDSAKESLRMLKRMRQNLNDKLLELNVSTTIKLKDDVVLTLKEEGLI